MTLCNIKPENTRSFPRAGLIAGFAPATIQTDRRDAPVVQGRALQVPTAAAECSHAAKGKVSNTASSATNSRAQNTPVSMSVHRILLLHIGINLLTWKKQKISAPQRMKQNLTRKSKYLSTCSKTTTTDAKKASSALP